MRVLNPNPSALRVDPTDRIASELLEAALALPDRDALERGERDASALHHLDPRTIRNVDARTTFWVNVYNALRLHVFHVDPPQTSVPQSLSRFRGYARRVGEHDDSLSIIHHGLLRGNRRPHWTWGPLLADGDPRLQSAPEFFDPRIHFALAFGAEASPSVRPFHADRLDAELRDAERDYVREHTEIEELATIRTVDPVVLGVPPMLRAYRADFGIGTKEEALEWVLQRLPDEKRVWLEERRDKTHMPWKLLVFGWAFPEKGWKK